MKSQVLNNEIEQLMQLYVQYMAFSDGSLLGCTAPNTKKEK